MNILIVTLAYEPAIAFGGPVKVVQNNARGLVRRGHSVTVYCTNRLDKQHKLSTDTIEHDDQGVRVVYHNTWFSIRWRGNFGPSFSASMLKCLLREGKQFDLIHINEARAHTTLLAGLYARVQRIPYIIQAHGSFIYGFRHQRLKRLYDAAVGRQIYLNAARVIALTPGEVPECQAVGIPPPKIIVIPNGINLAQWHVSREKGIQFRKQRGIPVDSFLVLFLGRVDKIKGSDLIIEALAELGDEQVYCVIAGPDDGYLEYTQQLVRSRRLSQRVIFTGPLIGDDVLAAYAAADVFVLPSRFDTFPMAILEAMASGLPVLTTETCQLASFIKNRAGVVVRVNSKAIAEGLLQLLDPKLRETFSRGAKELVENEFSIQRTVDHLESVYTQVIQEHRG